jgi:hypothetical protein
MPRVSVIISTFNGERHLTEAVESILRQTFTDFELLIVNDGSTDATREILEHFADDRISILTNEQNLGIAASQNRAIAKATGEYVALMDHDDSSLPQRLEMQVNFLNVHEEVAMVGSSCICIDERSRVVSVQTCPTEQIVLKWDPVLRGCPFVHTSLMIRRSAMEAVGGYSGKYQYAGDYELISKLSDSHMVANLSEPLVRWRLHSESASRRNAEKLSEEAMRISRLNATAVLGNGEIDDATWRELRSLVGVNPTARIDLSSAQVELLVSFLLRLQNKFYGKHAFPAVSVKRHRRESYRSWSKRLLVLACGRNGDRDLACRFTLLKWSGKLLMAWALGFQQS